MIQNQPTDRFSINLLEFREKIAHLPIVINLDFFTDFEWFLICNVCKMQCNPIYKSMTCKHQYLPTKTSLYNIVAFIYSTWQFAAMESFRWYQWWGNSFVYFDVWSILSVCSEQMRIKIRQFRSNRWLRDFNW